MSWLFGARKTPADLLRENKRMLDKAIRELDRERTMLQSQEKKLVAEIKRTAKQNQMAAVRVMAKDLIRTRHSVTKFYALKSQLQGVSLRMQTLKSTQSMADAMRCVRCGRSVPAQPSCLLWALTPRVWALPSPAATPGATAAV
jgi:charged multivesicular body protein 2A